MAPKRKPVSVKTTPVKARQPMKAYGRGSAEGSTVATTFSPHDSLATDGKSTAYFLRFSDHNISSPPKKPISPAKKKIPPAVPKKPHPAVKTSVNNRSPTKSRIPIDKNSKTPVRPASPLTRGRTASPRRRAERRGSDGFRTRSVSPKVLKRDNVVDMLEETNMVEVVNKCNKLLKNLDKGASHPLSHLSGKYVEPKLTKTGASIVNTLPPPIGIVGKVESEPLTTEPLDKRANIDTNNRHSDSEDAIEPSVCTAFIDQREAIEKNNTSVSYQLGTKEPSLANNNNNNIVTEYSEGLATNSSSETTSVLSATPHLSTTDSNTEEGDNGNEHTFQLAGYQENYECDNLAKPNEGETERDVNHETSLDGEISGSLTNPAIHSTPTERASREQSEVILLTKDKELPKRTVTEEQAAAHSGPYTRINMSSSWMDRLKEASIPLFQLFFYIYFM